jgi:hypothetical protein
MFFPNRYSERDKFIDESQECIVVVMDAKKRFTAAQWMFDVCQRFHLKVETFLCAMNIFKRYNKISFLNVCVSLMIASKFEEKESPSVKDWSWVTDNAISIEELIEREPVILKDIDYKIRFPLVVDYLTPVLEKEEPVLHYLTFLTTAYNEFDRWTPEVLGTTIMNIIKTEQPRYKKCWDTFYSMINKEPPSSMKDAHIEYARLITLATWIGVPRPRMMLRSGRGLDNLPEYTRTALHA